MPIFKEIEIGTVFNKLTVVEDLGMVLNPEWGCKKKLHLLRVKCECSTEFITPLSPLNTGITKSCGCLKKELLSTIRFKHGLCKHQLFSVWTGINKRCSNKNTPQFKDYGGRGIKVCESWHTDFMSFYNWANENNWQPGLQIDRINNNGDYEPTNCRMVTPKDNCNNKSNNRRLLHNGVSLTLTQWSEKLGIERSALSARLLNYGWSTEKALTTPTNI